MNVHLVQSSKHRDTILEQTLKLLIQFKDPMKFIPGFLFEDTPGYWPKKVSKTEDEFFEANCGMECRMPIYTPPEIEGKRNEPRKILLNRKLLRDCNEITCPNN